MLNPVFGLSFVDAKLDFTWDATQQSMKILSSKADGTEEYSALVDKVLWDGTESILYAVLTELPGMKYIHLTKSTNAANKAVLHLAVKDTEAGTDQLVFDMPMAFLGEDTDGSLLLNNDSSAHVLLVHLSSLLNRAKILSDK